MKKFIFLFIFVFFTINIFSQSYKVKDTLLTEQLDGNIEFKARDKIILGPGFEFDATNSEGKKFIVSIDENLIFKTDYQSSFSSIFDQSGNCVYNPDTSLAAMDFGGKIDINAHGAAVYTLPLDIVAGTSNMQPALTIAYNSQSGNGLMGMGWNISGLSSITRTGKNIYHDSKTSGISLDVNDEYSFDGQRLIMVDNNRFESELKSYNKITSYGDRAFGYEYFKIETKDGKIMYYGSSADSKVFITDASQIFSYLLKKVEDANGNYMIYNYGFDSDTKEVYLTSIEYTGNDKAALKPYNRVEFYYDKRDDKNVCYVAGFKTERTLILRKVKMFSSFKVLWSYEFEYVFDNLVYKLHKIYKYNSCGEKINPIIINYGTIDTALEEVTRAFPGGYDEYVDVGYGSSKMIHHDADGYNFGDFNNDGISDLLQPYSFFYQDPVEGTNGRYRSKFKIFLGDGTGNYNKTAWYENYYSTVIQGHQLMRTTEEIALYVRDMNSDGYDDIVIWSVCKKSMDSKESYYDIKVMLRDPSRNDAYFQTYTLTSFNVNEPIEVLKKRTISSLDFADLNNDGLQDVIMKLSINDYDAVDVFLIQGYEQNRLIYNKCSLNIPYDNELTLTINDINSNGYPDIITTMKHLKNNSCQTLVFECSLVNTSIMLLIKNTDFPNFWYRNFYGDFNGDGHQDILAWSSYNGGFWQIRLNNGKGDFIAGEYQCPITEKTDPYKDDNNFNYYLIDVNADGMCDIVEFYMIQNESSKCCMNVYYSTGTGFKMQRFKFDKNYPALATDKYNKWIFINKDVYPDFLFIDHSYQRSTCNILCFKPNNDERFVKAVMDGNGNTALIEYKSINNNEVYIGTMSGSYPVIHRTVPLNVVSSTIIDGVFQTGYKYFDATFNLSGLGFLGFMKNEVTDIVSDRVMSSQYVKNSAGMLNINNVVVKTKSSGTLISTENSLFSVEKLHEKNIIKIRPISNEKTNAVTGVKVIESVISYDEFDNQLVFEKKIYADNILQAVEKTEISEYVNNGSWCNYLPVSVILTKNVSKLPAKIVKTTYQYDALGNILQKFNDLGDDKFNSTVLYQNYNFFGRAAMVRTRPVNGLEKSESYNYDPTGRYILSETNPAGHKEFLQYDYITGNLISQTDVDGRMALYEYDNWGKLITTINPDGTKHFILRGWAASLCGNGVPSVPLTALFYSANLNEGIPEEYTFYDNRGLELRKALQQPESASYNWLYSDKNYDSYGRLSKEYIPSGLDNMSGLCTVYEYNDSGIYCGTVKKKTSPDNSFTIYTYEGLNSTTVYTAGNIIQKFTKTVDALGNTVKVTDNGGTINYTYYADGNVKSITHDGVTFFLEYDVIENRTKLIDPFAGTVLSNYNVYGELVSTQNAKQREENLFNLYKYDILGRVILKFLIRGTFETSSGTALENYLYTYGAVNNINGLKEEKSKFSKKIYNYDINGRVSEITEFVLSANGTEEKKFPFKYQYDDYGRLSCQIYPNGFSVSTLYDNRGYAVKLDGPNGKQLYNTVKYNKYGDIEKYNLGTFIEVNKVFDDQTRLVESSIGSGIYTYDIMNYEYYPDGNMSVRQNYELSESFQYDVLGRLVKSTVSKKGSDGASKVIENISYSGNRISSKDNVGNYTYNAKFAVDNITGSNYQLLNPNDCRLLYTPFLKVSDVIEGNETMSYTYGIDENRVKSVYNDGSIKRTKYYAGGGLYELKSESETSSEKQYCYFYANEGIAGVYIKTSGLDDGKYYYFFKDHLGSILDLIEEQNDSYTVREKYSYDAWGRRRNPDTWNFTNVPKSSILDRGFCFHEHLAEFNLINMNGRIMIRYWVFFYHLTLIFNHLIIHKILTVILIAIIIL